MTSDPGSFNPGVRDILERRAKNKERLKQEAPGLYEGFNGLVKSCIGPGALDVKHKELIAVAISVAVRCIPCLAHHANAAVVAGATRQEVLEAATVGVEFGGGPSFVAIRDNLLDFLDEIEESQS